MIEFLQNLLAFEIVLNFELKFLGQYMRLLLDNVLMRQVTDGEYLEEEMKRLSKLV